MSRHAAWTLAVAALLAAGCMPARPLGVAAPVAAVAGGDPAALAASGRELLVKLRPGRQAPTGRLGVRVKRAIAKLGWHVAEASGDPAATLAALRRDPAVLAAEPNRLLRLPAEPPKMPAAPAFSLRAAYDDPMLPNRAKTHARVQVEPAWALASGKGVVVAILDTGVEKAHPDLRDRLVPGWDAVNGDDDPYDDHSHGTACAGIVAATPNNGVGTAGIAPDARVMPVKVLNKRGVGPLEWAAAGIVWAADHGARVVSMSFGEDEPSAVLQDAVDYARGKGVLCIASMGNDGEERSHWPARCANVLAVGATYDDDRPALFTTEGAWVGISAPGTRVHTTSPTYEIIDPMFGKRDRDYTWFSGTSASSPVVAAVAALVLEREPGLDEAALRRRLRATADDVGDKGWDRQTGDGRVNAYRALTERP
jgi:subtilisin family serine protease